MHEDGKTFEMAPLQVFISAGGQTAIRIGRNILFFEKDGRFDGTESKVDGLSPGSPEGEMILEAFEVQGKNKGLAPDNPYFQPGTPGYAAETRAWGSAEQDTAGKNYLVVPKPSTRH